MVVGSSPSNSAANLTEIVIFYYLEISTNTTEHTSTTLQMFAGIYGGFIGKSECGDIKFMGIACNPQSL